MNRAASNGHVALPESPPQNMKNLVKFDGGNFENLEEYTEMFWIYWCPKLGVFHYLKYEKAVHLVNFDGGNFEN